MGKGSNFIPEKTYGEAHKKGCSNTIYLYFLPCCIVFVASADGYLYTWGRGFNSTSDVHCPQYVPSSTSFCQAALGWSHALVLTGIFVYFFPSFSFPSTLSSPFPVRK